MRTEIGGQLRALAKFATAYGEETLRQGQAYRLAMQRGFTEQQVWHAIASDWWLALIFFFDRAFYQGRRDQLSEIFEKATIQALGKALGNDEETRREKLLDYYHEGWLDLDTWGEQGNLLCEALHGCYDVGERKPYGTGKQGDQKMVVGTLQFIVDECPDWNILSRAIDDIKRRQLRSLSRRLQRIVGVGPKISSLFLRDVVGVYGLKGYIPEQDLALIFPMDTWLSNIGRRLFPSVVPGSGGRNLARHLVKTCLESGVHPIELNQGAWYVGVHSLNIILDNLERLG